MRVGAFRRVGSVVLQCCLRWQVLRRAHRLVLVAVLAVLSVGAATSLPAQARDGDRAAAKSKASRPAMQASRVGRELVGLRTRTSKTFVGRNGGRVARLYATPVHFKSRGRRWKTIDSRLRRVGSRLINRANRYSVAMPVDIGRGAVRVRRDSRWVQFTLRKARGNAQVRGSEAVYREALPGVTVSYRAQASSVKETLTLAGPFARRRFTFDLAVSRGLRPRLLGRRGLVLRDRRGRTRMAFAAPYMIDARGRESGRVPFQLDNVGGRWRLMMTPSSRWLDRPGRAWPVKVDPYVYTEPDQDCALDELDAGTSFCGTGTLSVGTTTHGGTTASHRHTTVLRFPGLSQIPRDVDVNWAAMVLIPSSITGSGWLEARPLTQPWSGQATWNHADGSERWHEPGGEPDPSGEKAVGDAWVQPGNNRTAWALHKMVRDWVTGRRPNHGVQISGPASLYAEFHAADGNAGTQGANEPRLEVEYAPRAGERRGWGFERMQLSDRVSLAVNQASGNLLVRQTDFSMPGGLGPDIAVTRSYNSLNEQWNRMGPGWTLDTGQDVKLSNWGSSRIYRAPSGVRVAFEWDGTKWVTPAGFDAKLKETSTGFAVIHNQSQTKEHFNSNGLRTSVEDRNGRTITFDYATSGQHRVLAIKNHAGETKASFTYDANEYLDKFTDAAGRVYDFGYDASGRLTSYADPENGAANPTRYEYGGCTCRITKITTPGGRITLIDYYPTGHKDAYKVKSVTRVTDEAAMTGPTWQFDYSIRRDGSGESEVTDPIGSASIDANDRIWRYTFDDQGRITKSRDPLGRETSQKLTSTSKVESYTAASNSGTTPNTNVTFDGDDNGKGTETPVGSGAIKGCADFGAPDPATGTASEKRCDDPAPDSTYGANGYQGVTGVTGGAYLPGRATNAQGNRTNFTWSSGGNLTGVEQTDKDGLQTATTSASYGNGTDGLPGRLNSITDGRNGTTTYGYTDGKGNVNTITPPAGLGATTIAYTTTIARVDKVTDGKGNRRKLTYDNLDRVTRIDFTGTDDVLGSTEGYVAYTYDRDGNQTAEDTREDNTTTVRSRAMTYDKLNRVTLESLPGGASNTYAYDLVGNLRSLTDAGGKVEYSYDAANQVRAVYEPGTTRPTKFDYDKDGNRTKTAYPAGGVTVSWGYDTASRLTEIKTTNAASAVLQHLAYKYSQPVTAGRETPLRQEAEDKVLDRRTRYSYDGLDRLTAAVTKPATATATDWNAAGANPIASYTYALDSAGNVTSRTTGGSGLTANTTTFAYNAANQLCWRSTAGATPPGDACTTAKQSTFDANGNELTSVTGRTALYNRLDQTTRITPSGGSPTDLVYLGPGQDRWTTEGTGSFQHNVLGVGKRTVGTSTDYFTRDEGGKLVSRRNGTTRHYYLFDALGSVNGLVDSTGALVARYDYEPYGGKEASTGTAAPNADVPSGQFGFAGGYRSVGGLYHYGQRFYDPAIMRWTQPDPLDQTGDMREGNRYIYAGGDPVGLADPAGTLTVRKDLFPDPLFLFLLNPKETRAVAAGAGAAGGFRIGGAVGAFIGAGGGQYLAETATERGMCLGVRMKASEAMRPMPFIYKCHTANWPLGR